MLISPSSIIPALYYLLVIISEKLDFFFCFKGKNPSTVTNKYPQFISYGIFEVPTKIEKDKVAFCEQCGYWQYSLLTKIIPYVNKNDFPFDGERIRELFNRLHPKPSIIKI